MSCIITPIDLNGRSLAELHTLLHSLRTQVWVTPPGSVERRAAMLSLDAVRWTIRQRQQALTPRF